MGHIQQHEMTDFPSDVGLTFCLQFNTNELDLIWVKYKTDCVDLILLLLQVKQMFLFSTMATETILLHRNSYSCMKKLLMHLLLV